MSIMKVTLIGMETALSRKNESVFDLMDLPTGINKNDVVDNIILESGDFEVLYPDPEFLRLSIGVWSRKHYRTFLKWITALNIEYNPLENYDRMESWGDSADNKRTLDTQDKTTYDSQDKRTLDTQDKITLDTQDKTTLDTQDKRTLDTEDKTTYDSQEKRTLDTQDKQTRDIEDKTTFDKTTTTEHEVSAYDSSSYQPASKDTQDEDGTVTVDGTGTDTMDHTGTDTMDHTGTDTLDHTGTDTLDHTGTDTVDHTGTDTTDHTGTDTLDKSGTDTLDHTGTISDEIRQRHNGRIHGNVGVTTSQQMLQAELDIARFNIVQQITDLFISEFCIMLYD